MRLPHVHWHNDRPTATSHHGWASGGVAAKRNDSAGEGGDHHGQARQPGRHGTGVQEEFQFRNLSGDPNKGLEVAGIFGSKTDAAVRGFQRAFHQDIPSVTVDGIVGPVTWHALVSGMLSFDQGSLTQAVRLSAGRVSIGTDLIMTALIERR
jgi:peptidoglycan hydrolase-like protein with peptidoglycan-binding domain